MRRRAATATPAPARAATLGRSRHSHRRRLPDAVPHLGLTVPLGAVTISDPFRGSAVPEVILGLALAPGSAAATLLVVLYGLSITLLSGRHAHVAYHLTLVPVLLIGIALLLIARGRRQLA